MKRQTITTLPLSPAEDRRQRTIKYSIMMGVRMVCLILAFFVHGWWLLIVALGAIFLPFFAVMIANAVQAPVRGQVEGPGGLIPTGMGAPSFGPDGTPTQGDARGHAEPERPDDEGHA